MMCFAEAIPETDMIVGINSVISVFLMIRQRFCNV